MKNSTKWRKRRTREKSTMFAHIIRYLYIVSLSNIDENFFLRINITLLYSIPNTKACSSYSSRCRGSFVLCILFFFCFFTVAAAAVAVVRALVIFIGVLTYFAASLCFTLLFLLLLKLSCRTLGASSSLILSLFLYFARAHAQKYEHQTNTDLSLIQMDVWLCVFVLSLSWHRQRHR